METIEKNEFNLPIDSYYIELWFNDLFGWALSYEMAFAKGYGAKKTVQEFHKWLDQEGQMLFDEMDKIPYPRIRYKQKHLDKYFKSNWEIGKKMIKSLNKYCECKFNEE
jgi:hypothetical protein